MKTSYQPMDHVPSANIAVKRNRLKQYGDKVYLKNGTSFEIELFNPKQIKVLTKIFLNGISISHSGIVLNPGQRVFLERWLDDPKKFLFETYDVEDSKEAKQAIAQNGMIHVEFYDQIISQHHSTITTSNGYYGGSDWTPSLPPFAGETQHCFSYYVGTQASYSASIETGRADVGESSDQTFIQDSSSYASYYASFVTLQIMPESSKPVESFAIRNYCSTCGIRIKSPSWKFCPSCGLNLA